MISPASLLGAPDLELVQLIAARCKGMRSSQALSAFYQDQTIQAQLRAGDDRARDRVAYMSGLVVAEVSLAQLSARAA